MLRFSYALCVRLCIAQTVSSASGRVGTTEQQRLSFVCPEPVLATAIILSVPSLSWQTAIILPVPSLSWQTAVFNSGKTQNGGCFVFFAGW
jgi:hypothetical protein